PFVSDLRRLSQAHRSGERPRRPPAEPRHLLPFLALANDSRSARREGTGAAGQRGCLARRRSHPEDLGGTHYINGGAQPLRRRRPLRHHHRPGARERAGRGELRRGLERSGRARGIYWSGTVTELLRLTDLHAFYGESHVLHGIDLNVHTSEVVTLLGRNGSGRSTTFK